MLMLHTYLTQTRAVPILIYMETKITHWNWLYWPSNTTGRWDPQNIDPDAQNIPLPINTESQRSKKSISCVKVAIPPLKSDCGVLLQFPGCIVTLQKIGNVWSQLLCWSVILFIITSPNIFTIWSVGFFYHSFILHPLESRTGLILGGWY